MLCRRQPAPPLVPYTTLFRSHRLAGFFVRLFVACAFAAQAPLSSAELYFNPRFLADDPQAVADLSRFENGQELPPGDRKSTRLNSSHVSISYAVFCLKKKNKY